MNEPSDAIIDGRLALTRDLDFDERRLFLAAARSVIDVAHGEVPLDCSAVDSVDDEMIAMLVVIARTAQRRGARVRLIGASEPLSKQLDASHVAHHFDHAT